MAPSIAALLLAAWCAAATAEEPPAEPLAPPAAAADAPEGAADAPEGAAASPYDYRRAEMPAEQRQAFEHLGYRFDEDSGAVVGPDGKSLSAAEFGRVNAPYDLEADRAGNPISSELRSALTFEGYRFDEEGGRILKPGNPPTPLTRLELAVLRKNNALGQRHAVLERLQQIAARTPDGGDIAPEDLAQIQRILAAQGEHLPPQMRALMTQAVSSKKFAQARAPLADAYAASVRLFDGHTTTAQLIEAAGPPARGPPGTVYFDQAERTLGRQLRADVISVFQGNSVGRELLAGFTGKDGKRAGFPGVIIVRFGNDTGESYDQAGAVYNPAAKSVMINYATAREIVGRGNAGLAAELDTPKKLNAYLARHPEKRRAVVAGLQVILAHEYTHAWQDERTAFTVEMYRGNAPAILPLSFEHEAWMNQNRYMHQMLKQNPAAAARDPYIADYQSLLGDYDRWRSDVDRTYLAGWPTGSVDMPTAREIQNQRAVFFGRTWDGTWNGFKRMALRAVGLSRGSEALEAMGADQAARLTAFRDKEYPGMRVPGLRLVARGMTANGRPEQALGALGGAYSLAAADADVRRDYDAAAAATLTWLGQPQHRDWLAVHAAVSNMNMYYATTRGDGPADQVYPNEYVRTLGGAYTRIVDGAIAAAAGITDAATRESYLAVAEAYVRVFDGEAGEAYRRRIAEVRKNLGGARVRQRIEEGR